MHKNNSVSEEISVEEKVIITYGIRQGCVLLAGFFVVVLLGLVFGVTAEALLFFLFSYGARIYAGGYHAGTRLGCGVFSFLLSALCCAWLKFVVLPLPVLSVLVVSAAAVICLFAPVAAENRPLDSMERQVFGKKARIIVLSELLIYGISAFWGWKMLYASVSIGILLVALLVIAGKADRCGKERTEGYENTDM